jgi:hypothetical protein
MFDSICPNVPKALQPYGLIECHPGTAPKVAMIPPANFHLLLLLPLHSRLHLVLLALPAFKLARDMYVPPYLSEHPEDLYDTLQPEFSKAVIKPQTRRSKTRPP